MSHRIRLGVTLAVASALAALAVEGQAGVLHSQWYKLTLVTGEVTTTVEVRELVYDQADTLAITGQEGYLYAYTVMNDDYSLSDLDLFGFKVAPPGVFWTAVTNPGDGSGWTYGVWACGGHTIHGWKAASGGLKWGRECGVFWMVSTNAPFQMLAAGACDVSTEDCHQGEISGPVGGAPDISLTKTADPTTVEWGDEVTYTYTVTNTGSVDLHDVTVTDDNGTPDQPGDDFVVGTVALLAPGEVATFTVTKTLQPMCDGGQPVGMLEAQMVPDANGDGIADIKITYVQSRGVVDNTYGANASPGYTKRPNFSDRVGSDKAEFRLTNGDDDVVLHFFADYISESGDPSGYGTLGVSGREGEMVAGDAASVLTVNTSLSDNLNQSPEFYGFTVDSPPPPEPYPGWDYFNSYTIVVSGAAFEPSGFGGVTVLEVHNSPQMKVEPWPCEECVTNTATVTATDSIGLDIVATGTADETVCVHVEPGQQPPPGVHKSKWWKDHPGEWPVDEITVGGVTYTKADAIQIMKKRPDKKDMTYKMFVELVAAKLNVLIGNDDAPVAATIAAGDAWLTANPLGSKVGDKDPRWKNEGKALCDLLKKYNEGKLGVPSAR